MKKIFIAMAMLAIVGGVAQAQTKTDTRQSQTSVNDVVNSSGAAATNQGNAQSITFTSPEKTTSTVNSNVSGTTTSNVNQAVSGTTTQNVNSHISGEQTQNVNYGTQTIKNTPSVSGPNLTSSNDTCMGSASGGVNAPGFGLSLGKTYVDENCKMLKNSRELWNMGMKAASMALMCMDANNRSALEMTGYVCPQSAGSNRVAAVDRGNLSDRDLALKRGEPVDPIVRQRMGLPTIKE